MLKYLIYTCLSALLLNGFNLNATVSQPPTVIVTVAPHEFFVKQIAKETLDVYLMVPPGASSHTYEPSPRQMIKASTASLWFSIGEPFERKAMQALQSYSSSMKIVNLQVGLDLICHQKCHQQCCPGSVDLHFWLSPKLAKIQAKTMADALSEYYPEHQSFYQTNLKEFHKKLDAVDQEIMTLLAPLKMRDVFVGHPAYAYFCRDYNLRQHPIEMEGKDPTPQQITKLLEQAKALSIKMIFVQPQYSNKAADLIAKQIGAKLITLNPYSIDYLSSLLEIARAFSLQVPINP